MEDIIATIDKLLVGEVQSGHYYIGVLKSIKERLEFERTHKWTVTNFNVPVKSFAIKQDAIDYVIKTRHEEWDRRINNEYHII